MRSRMRLFPGQGMPSVTAEFNDQEFNGLVTRLEASPEERKLVLRRLLGDGACRQLGLYPIPADFRLSVVIPVYNERQWIRELVRRVEAVPVSKEIIVVDDFSTDGTRDILRELESHPDVRVFYQPHNQGKGAALREGFRQATGSAIVGQELGRASCRDSVG